MRYKKSKSIKQIDNREKNLRRMSDKVIRLIEKDSEIKLRYKEKKSKLFLDRVKRRGEIIEFDLGEKSLKHVSFPEFNCGDMVVKLSGGKFDYVAVDCIPALKIYKIGRKTGGVLIFYNQITFKNTENKESYVTNTTVNIKFDKVEMKKFILDDNARYSIVSSGTGKGLLMFTKICISKLSVNKFAFKRKTDLKHVSDSKEGNYTEAMMKSKTVSRAEVEQIIDALDKFSTVYELI